METEQKIIDLKSISAIFRTISFFIVIIRCIYVYSLKRMDKLFVNLIASIQRYYFSILRLKTGLYLDFWTYDRRSYDKKNRTINQSRTNAIIYYFALICKNLPQPTIGIIFCTCSNHKTCTCNCSKSSMFKIPMHFVYNFSYLHRHKKEN